MKKDKTIYPYIVVLRQKNRFRIQITGIIASFIYVLILLQRIFEHPGTRIINVMLLIAVSGIIFYNIRLMRNGRKISMTPVYVVACLSLLIIPPISWYMLLFLLLALFERAALMPEEIGLGEEGIVFNSLIPRRVRWTALNQVILKDGLLTIDFKNDQLIQRETDDEEDEDYDATEEEFNEYCAEKLKIIADSGIRISDK